MKQAKEQNVFRHNSWKSINVWDGQISILDFSGAGW